MLFSIANPLRNAIGSGSLQKLQKPGGCEPLAGGPVD